MIKTQNTTISNEEAFESELKALWSCVIKNKDEAYDYIDELVRMYKKWNSAIPGLYEKFFREAMDLADNFDLDVVIISKKCAECKPC